ncbi:aminodeoxychorismate synthase component I [Mesorhizobium sp. 1B3]|uniref:aminodeoxychorismate synthase component I n=1 Tax=Mesorhizobium sp. 1B3 TaxID=3243599 RepID=UPI003D98DFF4
MTAMPASPFVLFRDDFTGAELLFDRPSTILSADTPEQFDALLAAAEAAHAEGKWLAGYFSYEAGYLFEPKLRPILPAGRRAPLACIGVFDGPSDNTLPPPGRVTSNGPVFDPRPAWSFEAYEKRFRRLHQHLREGDCYQANLTFPIDAHWSGDPLAAFHALAARQRVKYGALVSLGNPVVLSRSPELFFEVGADGWIETHPMKGTAPRGKTPAEDARLREFLQNDPKNQAENRMIVDLLRNDISLVTEVGTLDVPELFRVESYATVHQMVSRVRAKLLPNATISQIFAALFPCGSITGAPKIRAMEILHELEGRPRDVYCGAIGWIEPSGRMRFNVAIRTISLYSGGDAVFNVGGGIVFDSSAEAEYAECLLKARYATGTALTTN